MISFYSAHNGSVVDIIRSDDAEYLLSFSFFIFTRGLRKKVCLPKSEKGLVFFFIINEMVQK